LKLISSKKLGRVHGTWPWTKLWSSIM